MRIGVPVAYHTPIPNILWEYGTVTAIDGPMITVRPDNSEDSLIMHRDYLMRI